MLRLVVQMSESYDETTEEFVSEDLVLELEHSLVSLSKWESKFEKPFLGPAEKTTEEVMAYIEAMIITPVYPAEALERLTSDHLNEVQVYLSSKQTATWFNETSSPKRSTEIITSELIYYWMVSYKIPWEAQTWHLNRLFTLIRVFNAKNEKKKSVSPNEAAAQRRALNEQRKAQYKTRG